MKAPTISDFEIALSELELGLPEGNEPYDTGTGELDNGKVRALLAGAVWTVIRYCSEKSSETLSKYFQKDNIAGWFGEKRAELIITMLLYQANWSDYSTWLSLYARDLQENEQVPDIRWKNFLNATSLPSKFLARLAQELTKRLELGEEAIIREKREMKRLLAAMRDKT